MAGLALRAIDVTTGDRKWEFRYTSPSFAGVLSTASGVVFSGDNEGNFIQGWGGESGPGSGRRWARS